MNTKPRPGGKRDGAGRKSISKVDRLLIGARAETELRTLGRQLRDSELPYAEIAESRAALVRVPLSHRKKKSGSYTSRATPEPMTTYGGAATQLR